MIVRILIALFASVVASVSYLTGMARLMTSLLVGFGACSSFFFGILFLLPADGERLLFPVYEQVPAWPFFVVGLILCGMIGWLYYARNTQTVEEQVSSQHFKYFLGGVGCYLTSLFFSSIFWFPSDAKRLSADLSALKVEVLLGTIVFLIGVTVSCFLFYRASRGSSLQHADLMRRFVLGFFSFFHFDKMPLLVAYLLIYAPKTEIIFPNIAALALVSYIPVSIMLVKITLETK